MKFKKGDKVILLKNILRGEFASFGNEDSYIEKAATAKYLTIKIIDGEHCHLSFYEIPQWWRTKWFKKLDTQLELNFEGEENDR